jgi:hypothetical protein
MPASRHQDHTISPYALAQLVNRAATSTAACPTLRDDRETPLSVGQDEGIKQLILGRVQNKIMKIGK